MTPRDGIVDLAGIAMGRLRTWVDSSNNRSHNETGNMSANVGKRNANDSSTNLDEAEQTRRDKKPQTA
jgi:hypothetical protein